MHKKKLQQLTFGLLGLGLSLGLQAKDYFISPQGSESQPGTLEKPFANLEQARDAIRGLSLKEKQEDITVYLRGGTYQLKKTFLLNTQDSALDGFKITYSAYKNEVPVLSSAVKITGWKKSSAISHLNEKAHGQVWEADIPTSIKNPRVLFDGDTWQPRSSSDSFLGKPYDHERADSMGPLYEKDLWTCKKVPWDPKFDYIFRNWDNIQDIECAVVPVPWTMSLIQLKEINLKERYVTMAFHANAAAYGKKNFCTNWLQNSVDFISEPGNWASNTKSGKVYYWPKGDQPSPEMSFPALDVLVKVEGDIDYEGPVDTPVRNIVFKGLTFKHAKRGDWYKDRKGWGIQHDWDTFDFDNALLRFRGAENCEVTACQFTATGGTGMRLDLHAQNIDINNNLISYTGHMGILLCGYGPGTKDVNRNNIISNNIIHHVGEIIWNGHGIFAWQSGSNKIINNTIHDVPRKGIGLCGVRCQMFMAPDKWWDEGCKTIRWHEIKDFLGDELSLNDGRVYAERCAPFLHARNNIVENNLISNALRRLNDGAALNVSGAGKGNIVRHNMVRDLVRHNLVGIRTDDWQRDTLIINNIVMNNPHGRAFVLKDRNIFINNIVYNVGQMITNRPYPKQEGFVNSQFIGNIVVNATKYGGILKQSTFKDNIYFFADAEKGILRHKKKGADDTSTIADPLFADPANGDFTLSPDSPALKLGFKPFDTRKESFGIRKDKYPARLMALDSKKDLNVIHDPAGKMIQTKNPHKPTDLKHK
ncbi:right-handed parallel beta-helix repeat-containing protein [Lentisphaera profundi]|uniref:Right-handed parallel beta-helix repeat-containing protein n=1 Tax=Lentisphaera profundi TaxID=1658616 RepID=A0ABY7VR22_9BACT|nr:right-handed parallel beta-helix repeat-containing protein [Lentisphaera profundi]WDE96467.1 right-handed parallel beta-helix repeat-containing protein [Lentisphaera profundi]